MSISQNYDIITNITEEEEKCGIQRENCGQNPAFINKKSELFILQY